MSFEPRWGLEDEYAHNEIVIQVIKLVEKPEIAVNCES